MKTLSERMGYPSQRNSLQQQSTDLNKEGKPSKPLTQEQELLLEIQEEKKFLKEQIRSQEAAEDLVKSKNFWVVEEIFQQAKGQYQNCCDAIIRSKYDIDNELIRNRNVWQAKMIGCQHIIDCLDDCLVMGDDARVRYNEIEEAELGINEDDLSEGDRVI